MTDVAAQFHGECWSVSEQAQQALGTFWIRHSNGPGFNLAPDTINGGGNSGHQAIHLAATFGAKRILLLGYDMQRTGGKSHWHGDHIAGLINGRGFPRWIAAMDALAKDLAARGVEVVNCSRQTALKCFPRGAIEAELAK